MGPIPDVARATTHRVPVPAGGIVQVRVYESADILDVENRPVYLNYHGGGWTFGGFESDRAFCCKVTNWVGCVVVDVDYRLAPEHPWPAQLQDSWAAFLWVSSQFATWNVTPQVRENAELLGIDPENIIIGGVSAGGHLAAIIAQRCLALQIPLKLQILTVPAVDLITPFDRTWNLRPDCSYPSYAENAKAPLFPIERLQYCIKHFLGPQMPHPIPAANPAVLSQEIELSPITAGSLTGLAPALVTTADVDMLRDEGEAYARRLETDGVNVDLKRFMGVPHPFTFMAGTLPEAREYIQRCCDAMKISFGIL